MKYSNKNDKGQLLWSLDTGTREIEVKTYVGSPAGESLDNFVQFAIDKIKLTEPAPKEGWNEKNMWGNP